MKNVLLLRHQLDINSKKIVRIRKGKGRFRLTLSWRRPISYRNQSIDLWSKSMDWFLYDISLRHERVKPWFSRRLSEGALTSFYSCLCSCQVLCPISIHIFKKTGWKIVLYLFSFLLLDWKNSQDKLTTSPKNYVIVKLYRKCYNSN